MHKGIVGAGYGRRKEVGTVGGGRGAGGEYGVSESWREVVGKELRGEVVAEEECGECIGIAREIKIGSRMRHGMSCVACELFEACQDMEGLCEGGVPVSEGVRVCRDVNGSHGSCDGGGAVRFLVVGDVYECELVPKLQCGIGEVSLCFLE